MNAEAAPTAKMASRTISTAISGETWSRLSIWSAPNCWVSVASRYCRSESPTEPSGDCTAWTSGLVRTTNSFVPGVCWTTASAWPDRLNASRSASSWTGCTKLRVITVPPVKSMPGRKPPGSTSEISPGTMISAETR